MRDVDQTSAARLLPMQVLPAEKLAADGTALRSFSPQDIADIGFAATPAPTVQTGTSYTLALADNHRLVECANAAAITVTVPTNAAVAFPLGARIEIAQTGAGQITVSGAGVTLRLPSGKTGEDPPAVLDHRPDQAQHRRVDPERRSCLARWRWFVRGKRRT